MVTWLTAFWSVMGGGAKGVMVVFLTAMWSVLGDGKSVMVNCDVVGDGPVPSVVPDE